MGGWFHFLRLQECAVTHSFCKRFESILKVSEIAATSLLKQRESPDHGAVGGLFNQESGCLR